MKRVFIVAIMMVLTLTSCDKPLPVQDATEVVELETVINEDYEALFDEAKINNDYVGMNRAQEMLGNADFDYTHGGVLNVYNYSCENETIGKKEGKVYILSLPSSYTLYQTENIADRQSIEDNDYVVIDYTYLKDPCMQVRNSYRADNYYIRECILDILIKHEEENPTKWDRTKNSMEMEWYVHNLSYAAQYRVDRAQHVDLDNSDENVY